MEEQGKEEILELDAEQLQELMNSSDKLPPIEIPMEFYDTDEFFKGIQDTSYLAGVITAILNTGVSEGFVLDYLMNKDSIAHSIKVSEINKEMNIEIAKNQKATIEKNEL